MAKLAVLKNCLPSAANRGDNIIEAESMKRMSITMKNGVLRALFYLATVAILASVSSAEVLKVVLDDTIQPITEEYISRAIDEAERRNDQAVLIEINTPGGLVDSTRKIIEKITTSP